MASEALKASIKALQDANPVDANAAAREFVYTALAEFFDAWRAYQAGDATQETVRDTLLGRAVDDLLGTDWQ